MRSAARIAGLLMVAIGGLAGCYQGRAYVRPSTVVVADHTTLLQSVVEETRAQGLRVTRVDPERGRVVAVSRVDRSMGVETRERWRFFVADERVRVEMQSQIRTGAPGRPAWERTDYVCDCYRYQREREMLERIRARATAEHVPMADGNWLANLERRMR